MAKFYGKIGFAKSEETSPGVWTETGVELPYYGDILRNTRRWESGEHLNDNLVVNNMISIVADRFACENFYAMRYVRWMGTVWEISNVEVEHPRLRLTIGEVYNGKTFEAPGDSGESTGDG